MRKDLRVEICSIATPGNYPYTVQLIVVTGGEFVCSEAVRFDSKMFHKMWWFGGSMHSSLPIYY